LNPDSIGVNFITRHTGLTAEIVVPFHYNKSYSYAGIIKSFQRSWHSVSECQPGILRSRKPGHSVYIARFVAFFEYAIARLKFSVLSSMFDHVRKYEL
jgi:hypothetical protein